MKLEVDKVKTGFENKMSQIQESQSEDNSKQLSLIQNNKNSIAEIVKGLELDI